MKTYEELMEVRENPENLGRFIVEAVNEYEGTEWYKTGLVADSYYNRHNLTIETFVKWLYTMSGRQVRDDFSANFHLQTHFFRRKVTQHSNYLLGKGVQLSDADLKKKLGKNFDHQMLTLVKYAMVAGRSYGFWNNDHLEVFSAIRTDRHAGFCPLESVENGEMMAGIRFWRKQIGKETVYFYTLYELSGYTEYRRGRDDMYPVELQPFKRYKSTTVYNKAEGVLSVQESDYGTLPIISFYASDTYASDFDGIREAIDCYDLTKSGLANNIADAQEIYWIIKNAGGMQDKDIAKFLARIRKAHGASVDSEDGGDVEAHTIDTPYEARKELLEIIRTDLYDDMCLLDRRTLSAAQKTQQELDMAYQPMDDYINDLEFFVYDFLDKLFPLAGLPEDTEATMLRNKVANNTEITNMVLNSGQYLDPETVIKHLPFLTPEEAEEAIKNYVADQQGRTIDFEEEETEDGEE